MGNIITFTTWYLKWRNNLMKRYLVSVWTRQSYTQWVEAESEEKAK